MKLPKSIIKKYGITKKAWSVFRNKSRSSPKTVRSTTTMARRRVKRTRARSFFRKKKGRSKKSGFGSLAGLVVGSAIYGAGREWASDKLQPLSSKIPAGAYADEVTMGAVSYLLMKGKVPFVNKLPFTREIGKAGLTIEAARIGAGLASGMMPSMTSTASTGSWQ